MDTKIALVTGANTGVGLETARGLAERGYRVFVGSRNAQRGQVAVDDIRATTGRDDVTLLQLDLADTDAIRTAAAAFLAQSDRLDVLVNNAGLMLTQRSETAQGFETTFGVNHLGHFLLTHLLRPALAAAPQARVVQVASAAHKASKGIDLSDPHYRTRSYTQIRSYGDSKLANILFARGLAKRWADDDIHAFSLHPGVIRSRFAMDGDTAGLLGFLMPLGRPFMLSPAKGARTSIHCATDPGALAHNGGYFARSKVSKANQRGCDDAAADALWDFSLKELGLS